MIKNRSIFVYGVVFVAMAFVSASPADAQREIEPLFDKFNFKLEGSWVALKTDIRLDSEVLGRGTTLSFEDDLDLDGNKTIPTVAANTPAASALQAAISCTAASDSVVLQA